MHCTFVVFFLKFIFDKKRLSLVEKYTGWTCYNPKNSANLREIVGYRRSSDYL